MLRKLQIGALALRKAQIHLQQQLRKVLKYRKQFLDLMVGVPNYERYLEHMKNHHPGESVKSRKEFFCEAQEARYNGKGGKISRCC